MSDDPTLHFDINQGKGTFLYISFIAVLHFTATVGSAKMSSTNTLNTLKRVWNGPLAEVEWYSLFLPFWYSYSKFVIVIS